MSTINNKNQAYKNLVCISQNSSSTGAIKFIIEKIKQNNTKFELFTVIKQGSIFKMFLGGDNYDEMNEYNNAKKYLKNIVNQIFNETGQKILYSISNGDLDFSLKEKIMNDPEISLVIFGANQNSWEQKKLPSLMKRFFTFSTVPLIIIPENITDMQINNIIYNN